jgi:hypothetical protein
VDLPEGMEVKGGSDDGELVQAAFAADEIEAEMIQGLLESAGVPSLLQPTGFNGPQMLGGMAGAAGVIHGRGSQRVMVHAGRLEEARALLAEYLGEEDEQEWPETANARHLEGGSGPGSRIFAVAGAFARIWLFGAAFFAVAFGVFLLLRAL